MRVIELYKSVTDSNDRDAAQLRAQLEEKGILLVNLMSSAGSGKTTLLERTIRDLNDKVRIAVLEADIDASVDAERIQAKPSELKIYDIRFSRYMLTILYKALVRSSDKCEHSQLNNLLS